MRSLVLASFRRVQYVPFRGYGLVPRGEGYINVDQKSGMLSSHQFAHLNRFYSAIRHKDTKSQEIVKISSDWTDSLIRLLGDRLWS